MQQKLNIELCWVNAMVSNLLVVAIIWRVSHLHFQTWFCQIMILETTTRSFGYISAVSINGNSVDLIDTAVRLIPPHPHWFSWCLNSMTFQLGRCFIPVKFLNKSTTCVCITYKGEGSKPYSWSQYLSFADY